VSEEVTGIDLVREQFRLAEGETLDYEDPEVQGHSIEFRINGEDPGQGFLPMPGPVHALRLPGGPGIRIDSGVTSGDVVTGAFDSLLAKLIVTGNTRQDAIDRARRALKEFEIAGLPTVLPFHRAVLEEEDFVTEDPISFNVHTTWIEQDFANTIEPWSGSISENELIEDTYRTVVVEVEGRRLKVGVPTSLFSLDNSRKAAGKAPRRRISKTDSQAESSGTIRASMQSTVIKVAVTIGEAIQKGDILFVLEAMKMEQPVLSEIDGIVEKICVVVGDSVVGGALLAEIGPSSAELLG